MYSIQIQIGYFSHRGRSWLAQVHSTVVSLSEPFRFLSLQVPMRLRSSLKYMIPLPHFFPFPRLYYSVIFITFTISYGSIVTNASYCQWPQYPIYLQKIILRTSSTAASRSSMSLRQLLGLLSVVSLSFVSVTGLAQGDGPIVWTKDSVGPYIDHSVEASLYD